MKTASMNVRFQLGILLVMILAAPVSQAGWFSRAKPVPPAPPAALDLAAVDRFFQETVAVPGHVGFSVAVVRDGRCVMAKGYGRRSLDPSRPMDATTMCAIGSVSKQFTAVSILLLAEDGKLSPQDKVAKYFPGLTRAGDITLLDLMNHVSGYRDYYPLDFLDRRMVREAEVDAIIKQYAGMPLDFEPGARFSYSNTGFLILGRVVELVSGRPLGTFLQERIFGPLRLEHTAYEPPFDDVRLAPGYTSFALSPPEPVRPEARHWLAGAGAIYSTAADLAAWDIALMEGKLLHSDSFKLLTTPRWLPDGRTTEYGCGVGVKLNRSREVVAHGGAVSGFNTWNGMVPSLKSAVVIIANIDGGVGDLPAMFTGLMLKQRGDAPHVEGLDAAAAARRFFLDLQRGRVDRARLAPEFNAFLSPEVVKASAKRLRPFGALKDVQLLSSRERGGLEVTTARLTFKSGSLTTLMYRQPGGLVEQFFVSAE